MPLLDKLQRRFGRFGVPHVTEALIAGQVLVYVVFQTRPTVVADIALVPRQALDGQAWRLLSFVFEPPFTNLLFALFAWYLFYLMGTVLENTWGALRYNLFLLVGWLATVAASFLQLDQPASVRFLGGSVFLAFAYLYPNFELLLFFVLPVKVKWLALLTWIGYFFTLAFGSTVARLMVAASVCNFLLFFWRDILLRVRSGRFRMADQAKRMRTAAVARHTCVVCGATNLSAPQASFRYCSKCAGAPCYCDQHMHDHQHLVAE